MRNPGASFLARLESDSRDWVDLVEFYTSAQTSLTPSNADKLFGPSAITWNSYNYSRGLLSRGQVQTFIDGKFNTCSVNLSNVDRTVATWLAGTNIKGYRMLIRRIFRSVDNDSDVIFIGRCDQASDIGNDSVSITAKQDLGNIEVSLPFRVFSKTCQVAKGFKGTECLAGEALGSKDAAYQAASTCNYSYEQCLSYVNTKAFQGQRFIAMSGNFKLRSKTLGFISKSTTKQWSSQDGSANGKAVPLGFGRTQIELIPMVFADTGQYLAGQSAIGEGPISVIQNFRPVSDGWASTFQFSDTHLGEYGPDSEQTPTGFFSSSGMRHSHMAYVEYTIKGNNPDTGDAAPTLVAVILWGAVPYYNGTDWSSSDWSDNPVAAVRWLLTDSRSLAYNTAWIDDTEAALTYQYCNEAIKDVSGGEDLYLSDEMSANGGVDLIRYKSTSVIDRYHFRTILGLDATYAQEQQASYNYVDTSTNPTTTASAFYRRRYTANFNIVERLKATDFLFKKLLPSFRGYLITGQDGKIKIKCEKPQLTQYLRAATSAGATMIAIEDAAAWKALSVPHIYGIIDVWTSQAETFKVSSVDYSAAGNSVTLTTSVTGTITATASGATLSGGSSSTQASGTVTIGGTITAGNVATITIDGVANAYTISSNDTTGTIAGMLATIINANVSINRYIVASWSSASPTVVTITCKLGYLNLSTALTYAHDYLDEVMHVHACFSDASGGALTRSNIAKNSFKWPLANREDEYNQFTITFNDAKADFAETQIIENDYTRQATTNQPIKMEIDGSCVDNFDQANRLVVGARYKYGEDKFFVSFNSKGFAGLLEVGDVIAVNHSNMPSRPHIPVIIEELKHEPNMEVSIVGRRYKKEMFPSTSAGTTIAIETAVTWPTNGPEQPTGLTLTTPTNGTIRGTFAFGIYQGRQTGQVWVKKAGAGAYVDSGIRVTPDSSNNGTFEITGLPGGTTYIEIIPVSQYGTAGTTSSAVSTTVTATAGTSYPFTAADPWTITHNLGYYPAVVCYDGSGNQITTGVVTNTSVNVTVVTFGVAKTGTARVY